MDHELNTLTRTLGHTLRGLARRVGEACPACGRPTPGVGRVSLRGEVTCVVHPVTVHCAFCRLTHPDPDPEGWTPFGAGLLRCRICTTEAVQTQERARAELPAIRQEMARIGVQLADRVRVQVAHLDDFPGAVNRPNGGILLGLTDQLAGSSRTTVTGIRILAGLPKIFFGRATAHEMGHAWLAQHGRVPIRDDALNEGVCELFSYAWLKRQDAPIAESLRVLLAANSDPVYGDGFRRVHEAVGRDGIAIVLARLLQHGDLSVST
jgi:hypothetical protein